MPQSYIPAPVNITGTSASAPTPITSIQIPSAGKWDVRYFVKMIGSSGYAALYGDLGGIIANTEISGTIGTGVTESSAIGRITFTTTGAQTLSLRGWGTYQAVSGATGRTGIAVELLEAGPKGDTGERGPAGAQGERGLQGAPGINGTNGAPGVQGITGERGPSGFNGVAGTNGKDGAQGAQGAQGVMGPIGLTGATGPQGPQGYTGPPGQTGVQGPAGPAGATGARGQEGTAGKSVTVFVRTTPPDSNLGVAGDIWYQY